MLTQGQLNDIETRLKDRMLAKLNMRWPKSGAYIPPGGSRVHVAAPLSEADDHEFNLYLTAYKDAIVDFMLMLDPQKDTVERLLATMPAHMARSVDHQSDLVRASNGRKPQKGGPRRGERRDSAAALEGLRRLFKGGSNDV